MIPFKSMIKAIRAPFFVSLVASGLVGAAVAWQEGSIHWGYLLLTLFGIIATNAGLNMSNDYFDHLSGNDAANKDLTPFSGGSRTIQDGILSPKQVLMWSFTFFAVAILIGLYLTWARGLMVLWLGMAGMFVAFFSSAPPISLNYKGHGLGELATFLGCGPLIVLGAYYVQTQQVTWGAAAASIPVGLLGAALIWINEFPDYAADKASGKNTLVVVLGRRRAVWGYVGLLVGCYMAVAVGVGLSLLPTALLVMFLTLPLAYSNIRGTIQHYSNTSALLPTNAATIKLYLANSVLLCVGYGFAKLL